MLSSDRHDAGRKLATRLEHYAAKPDAIVLHFQEGRSSRVEAASD